MSNLGHNNPPGMEDVAASTSAELSAWLADNPVIDDDDKARELKAFLDRGKLCIDDLEDERRNLEKPLTDQVDIIRARYREPRTRLQRVLDEAAVRLRVFMVKLQAQRIKAAEEAAKEKQAAIDAALAAEAAEKERLSAVNDGEVVDVDAVFKQTSEAFAEAERAVRASNLAERETKVKIGGGFKRALGLRAKEELIIVDVVKAVASLGATDDIKAAIIKSARAYRKLNTRLPDGVVAHKDDGI